MRDEHYILNLCDKVLKIESRKIQKFRQHCFDFLRGDKAERVNGNITNIIPHKGRTLPVDAYYKELNLVIEFLEMQHFKPIRIMDERMTCSGVTRGEQRKKYDKRRREKLTENDICLIEILYTDFNHKKSNGKLVRNEKIDELVIRTKLSKFLEA